MRRQYRHGARRRESAEIDRRRPCPENVGQTEVHPETLMKIADIRIDSSVLEKNDPEWKFALMAAPQSVGTILTIIGEDGTMGYGYGSAMPHYGATKESVEATLARFKPLLVGKDRKSTRLNSSHIPLSRMPSSA